MRPEPRPTLAVWKFASCDGCQLSLLDCEDELLTSGRGRAHRPLHRDVTGHRGRPVRRLPRGGLHHHPRRRRANRRDPGQLAPTRHHRGVRHRRGNPGTAQLRRVRCLRPDRLRPPRVPRLARDVHPISAHVEVDYELHGCPIDRRQLLEVLTASLAGRTPVIPGHSVCQECKGRGTVCLLVAGACPAWAR